MIAVSLIMSTNKKGHIALSLCIGLFRKALSASQLESSRNAMKRFFVKYRCIALYQCHYLELALCNASRVCLLGNTTWYAKSHAMSMTNEIQ